MYFASGRAKTCLFSPLSNNGITKAIVNFQKGFFPCTGRHKKMGTFEKLNKN